MFSLVGIMPPWMRTRSASRPAAESLRGGTGNDLGFGANGGVEGVNGNVEGANGGAPDFSTIITRQLQNLLPAMLAQIRTLSQEVAVSMSWNDFKFMMIEEFCPRFHELAGCSHLELQEVDDLKRKREYSHLAKDCRGVLRNVNPVNARNPTVRACYECGSTDHVRSACPRLNRAQGPEENRPNQVAANNGGQGRGNQGNQARGRANHVGTQRKARQGSEHCDSFVSTTFIPLLGLEPNELGFKYEIEIASGQLVEIDKVWTGCLIINDEIKLSLKRRNEDTTTGMAKCLGVLGEGDGRESSVLKGA
ncbi:putative reverse transcriptase domain-containing protein [Tanacetum coccineum]